MISFTCKQCGKAFSVGDEAAGRKGKCKACGAVIVVPLPAAAPQSSRIVISLEDAPAKPGRSGPSVLPVTQALPPPRPRGATPPPLPRSGPPPVPRAAAVPLVAQPMLAEDVTRKLPMRTRRLLADAELVRQAFQDFRLIRVRSVTGNPPDRYQIEYFVRGLEPGAPGIPAPRDYHLVEIQLTSEYPRQSPKCKALTPAFHPNISPVAICVGDHWTASERLVDLIIRIGEIIAYQAHNINSALDMEAATWVVQHPNALPTDTRDLRPPNLQ